MSVSNSGATERLKDREMIYMYTNISQMYTFMTLFQIFSVASTPSVCAFEVFPYPNNSDMHARAAPQGRPEEHV